jgi:transposase InsO family protein
MPLIDALNDLSRKDPRYGYRRITALLRAEGWPVNRKRVHRLWRQEGLKVPQKQRNAVVWDVRRTVARVVGPSMSIMSGPMIS